MTGYVVVVEGDHLEGYSCYAPDLPGVVAAAATETETLGLMRQAMGEHIAILRERGEAVPAPSAVSGLIVEPAA